MSKVYTHRGLTGTLEDIAAALGVQPETVRRQMRRDEEAAGTPEPPKARPTRQMRRERDVKEQVKRILKRLDAWYTMPYQAGFSQPGVPDFLICLGGRFVGLETKFGDNKPTAHQRRQLVALRRAGAVSLVVNEKNIERLESVLLAVKEGKA